MNLACVQLTEIQPTHPGKILANVTHPNCQFKVSQSSAMVQPTFSIPSLVQNKKWQRFKCLLLSLSTLATGRGDTQQHSYWNWRVHQIRNIFLALKPSFGHAGTGFPSEKHKISQHHPQETGMWFVSTQHGYELAPSSFSPSHFMMAVSMVPRNISSNHPCPSDPGQS